MIQCAPYLFVVFVVVLFTPAPAAAAPLTPKQMQQRMGLGINLGNTLDAPTEGAWAPKAQASFFDEYKAKGFTNVRIPVQWGHHLATTPPYAVDPTFLARVEEVVDWSLARGLVTVLNTHHDEWFEDAFAAELPRFVALWTQIAARFRGKAETLLFEIYNEPHAQQFSVADLNAMNAAVLPVIRAQNPTRIVLFGGLKFMNPSWVVANPDALAIPANDTQLMLEIHNYDPYDYAGLIPPTVHSWGNAADVAKLASWMDAIGNWSAAKGLPIFYGEFGCTTSQTAATGRYTWYAAHAKAIADHGFAAAVWDDDGSFRIFDRQADTWDEELLKALGKNP
jgi:endoglucanase